MAFTYFFRDRQTLDLIAQHVIPVLKQHTYINIWDAGCAMGPEPYSLAILLRENMGPFLFRNVRIHATDIDESGEFGEAIARGIYAEHGVQRVPPALLAKYFTPITGSKGKLSYQISEEMRKAVYFQRHDLLTLRPIREELGLIVCKNVLLHFAPEMRESVMTMFHAALASDGFLVVEQTQKLPESMLSRFESVSGAGQVFRKVPDAGGEAKETILPELLPSVPDATIEFNLDAAFTKVSNYTWINLELAGRRLGKARVDILGDRLTIYSLVVYPGFQNLGYARQMVSAFQAQYHTVVADCVRPEAREFWQKLGFIPDQTGNYIWNNS